MLLLQLTTLQKQLYHHLLTSKVRAVHCACLLIMIGKQAVRDTVKGKRADVLPLITTLKKLVNHPRLVYEVAAY